MKIGDKVALVLGAMIVIVIIGTAVGIPDRVIESIIEWGGSITVGIILGTLAGYLVEAFTNDWLKNIFLVVEIGKIEFSISLFTIATILVKTFLLS